MQFPSEVDVSKLFLSNQWRQDMGCRIQARSLSHLTQLQAEFVDKLPNIGKQVPLATQILVIKERIKEVGKLERAIHYQALAEFKARQKGNPMVFINQDGSCFMNVIAQLLFAIPGIRGFVESMPAYEFKTALLNLVSQKFDSGAAIAFVTEFRNSLKHWTYSHGGQTPPLLKFVLSLIPGLNRVARVLDYTQEYKAGKSLAEHLAKPEIEQSLRDAETLFVDFKLNWLGPRRVPNVPREFTLPGTDKTFVLIATLQHTVYHVSANIRESRHPFKWFHLSDTYAKAITATEAVDASTGLVMYQLNRELVTEETMRPEKRRAIAGSVIAVPAASGSPAARGP